MSQLGSCAQNVRQQKALHDIRLNTNAMPRPQPTGLPPAEPPCLPNHRKTKNGDEKSRKRGVGAVSAGTVGWTALAHGTASVPRRIWVSLSTEWVFHRPAGPGLQNWRTAFSRTRTRARWIGHKSDHLRPSLDSLHLSRLALRESDVMLCSVEWLDGSNRANMAQIEKMNF
jgi:hypothetical protein